MKLDMKRQISLVKHKKVPKKSLFWKKVILYDYFLVIVLDLGARINKLKEFEKFENDEIALNSAIRNDQNDDNCDI